MLLVVLLVLLLVVLLVLLLVLTLSLLLLQFSQAVERVFDEHLSERVRDARDKLNSMNCYCYVSRPQPPTD